MKKPEISFDSLPASAISETRLKICLKCAFDFFTKQLKVAPRTAYSELKKHVPEQSDFSGSSTARPHFFDEDGELTHCPYCNGPKRWFAEFRALRVDAHESFEKQRKKLWAALKKDPDRYTLWHPDRTQMQIFSDWLERLKRNIDFDDEGWLLDVAIEQIKRAAPSNDWEEALAGGVRRVQLSRQTDDGWSYDKEWLYVAPQIYGDVLMVQHLLSRSHLHGGRTFEGRLTLQELIARLRRIGYFDTKGITTRDPYEAFELAIAALVASGPQAVYYAVDRSDYLAKLKSTYEKKRAK
ncbi:MAG TPA: hypothetical protein VKA70_03420 [Blastocatellia bacterium]|nr:hypothetical protein [Blastocatellia bacterium]